MLLAPVTGVASWLAATRLRQNRTIREMQQADDIELAVVGSSVVRGKGSSPPRPDEIALYHAAPPPVKGKPAPLASREADAV